MKKTVLLTLIAVLTSNLASAQDLFIRADKYSTEMFLKIDPKLISSVKKLNNTVLISFKKNLKQPFTRQLDDKYIDSASATANLFTVRIKDGIEFTVLNDLSGVKVMATKAKTTSDILSSYGIGKPLLSSTSTVVEDKVQEAALNLAEKQITEKNFAAAAKTLNDILKTSKNDFYRQEAFYRLGQTYLLMAEVNSNYYIDAAQTFDDFARLYPDNFKASDALFKSAEAKDASSQLFEAVFTYRKIYDSVPDLASKRTALLKVANLYNRIGQTDNAVDSYKLYTKTFKSDAEKAYASLAQIYFDLREYDMAFESYLNLPIDKFINDTEVTPRQLHSMARTYEIKNKFDEALRIYAHIYENYPDSEYTNDSISRSADILSQLNRIDDSDNLLLHLKSLFPNVKTGQSAALQYATKYLDKHPYEYWKDFFAPMLQQDDVYALHGEANYMLLQSLYRDNKTAVLPEAEKFLTTYPTSPRHDAVNKIREEMVLEQLKKLFADKEYDTLEARLHVFKSEYPESVYKPEIDVMEDDIRFRKVLALYAQNKFKETIKAAEDHIIAEPQDKYIEKWFSLLDDAYFNDMQRFIRGANHPSIRAAARQYLTIMPNGKSKDSVAATLKTSFEKPYNDMFAAADYAGVVKGYDNSIDWLVRYIDNADHDRYKILLGVSAYKLGSKDKAKEVYSSITPSKETNYILLGLLVNDQAQRDNLASLAETDFTYLIKEMENTDPDLTVELLKQYTQNISLATQLEYELAKNTPSDAKREAIIMNVYDTLRTNKNARFEGSDDVTLDIGTIYFKKNDFLNAVPALREYVDNTKEVNDKKAEAYYYLGKSYINMNDMERGYQYYNELIKAIPDSVFSGIAKGEMEESNWKRSINGL